MRWLFGLLPLFASTAAMAAPAPAPVEGLWLNDDHKGIVRIAPCGRFLCGTLVKIVDPNPNAPKTDIHNSDPKLRGRPVLGMQVLTGFSGSGGSWKGGRAYDPESGKSYKSYLELNPDGSLKVSGCILFICESRRWTRVR